MARSNKHLNKSGRNKSRRHTKNIQKAKVGNKRMQSLAPKGYKNKNNSGKNKNKKTHFPSHSAFSSPQGIQENLKQHGITLHSDDIPSTSRPVATWKNSSKNKFFRSPKKSSPVNKFKKFRDDKVRKLLLRSRYMMHDKNKLHHGIENTRVYLNRSSLNTTALKRQNGKMSINGQNQTKVKANTIKERESDDDCIIVEQFPSHYTILDDNDSDADDNNSDEDGDDCENADDDKNNANCKNSNKSQQSTSSPVARPSYHGFLQSLNPRNAATPCAKMCQPNTNSNTASTSPTKDARNQFFVDLVGDVYLNKVTYNTVAPLTGNRQAGNKSENESVVIVDADTANESNGIILSHEANEKDLTSSSEEEDDDSSDDEENEGKEEGELEDDSVIFVSESNSNDFIAITSEKDNNRNKRQLAGTSSHPTPTIQHYSNLLNKNEKRELQIYNSNAYNPNAGKVLTTKKRMVIIDGSNVAFKHSADTVFSVKGLSIAIKYFKNIGHEVKAVIPQYRMNPYKSTDPNELMRLHKSGLLVQTPCKNLPGLTSTSYDDRFILQLASELDAAIVSNDNYRDLMHENAAFKKIVETRVIGYTWCNDMFILPKDPYGRWGPTLNMILNRT